MTRVTVSIVSTREADRLAPCLRSVGAQRVDAAVTVVVVDNGGGDDTAAVAAREYPGSRVLRVPARRGFSENHNAAQAAVPGDVAVVLNPDVVLEPDCLAALLAGLARHPRAGLVAPLLIYPSGAVQPSARRFPRPLATVVRRTPLRGIGALQRFATAHHFGPPSADRAVDWVLGACLCARGDAWRDVGGLDPAYRPLYVEDIDLGWRLWRRGWEVWQIPAARAVHEHQAATDRAFWDRRTLWHFRGIARFVRRHPRILLSGTPPARRERCPGAARTDAG